MLRHARQGFASQDLAALDGAERLGQRLRDDERSLTERIVHPNPTATLVLTGDRQRLFAPVHVKRIGDQLTRLVQEIRAVVRDGTPFTARARREIEQLMDGATDLLVDLRDFLLTDNRTLRRHVLESGRALVAHANDCETFHEQRLIEGVCESRSSAAYLAIVNAITGIEWQTREIAEKLGHLTSADIRDLNQAFESSSRARLSRAERAAAAEHRPTPIGWVP